MTTSVVENLDSIDISTFVKEDANLIEPLKFFYPSSKSRTVLLILNQVITLPSSFFKQVWSNCDLHVCADGGANQLRAFDPSYIPEYIVGDLDSATDETLEYYKQLGSKIILQASQYYTDLDKSLSLINIYFNYSSYIDQISEWDTCDEMERIDQRLSTESPPDENSKLNVIIVGAVGGRFDQTMNAINKVWKMSLSRPYINSILLNPEHSEIVLLIPKGETFISYEKLSIENEIKYFHTTFEKSKQVARLRNVGILPLLTPSVISTKGLKWDVTNWPTSMLSNMSSCNLQVGEQGFIIETQEPLFINLEL